MKLNSRMQYALTIISELMKNKDAGNLKLQDISDKHKISIHFLEQVARDLRIAGIIHSKKGPGGGYYVESGDTNMLAVINAVSKTELKNSIESDQINEDINRYQTAIDEALSRIVVSL